MELLTKEDKVRFIWGHCKLYLLEFQKFQDPYPSPICYYVWSNPKMGGDNTIKEFDGKYNDFCSILKISDGRDQGEHVIKEICGEHVKFSNIIFNKKCFTNEAFT